MELENTIEMMTSKDYKERFKSEYLQTKIRYENLKKILIKHQAGTLEFDLACPNEVLEDQLYYMNEYLRTLQIRAEIEKIELS